MMRSLLAIAVLSLLLAACAGGNAFDAAQETVLTEALKVEALDRPVIVFALPEPLQPGDVIGAYPMEGFEPLPEPRMIEAETWFFFVDDFPGAEYAHPTRFVFVDVETGEVEVREEQWWPVLNGEGLWVMEAEYWDEANWIYSNGDFRPQHLTADRGAKPALSLTSPPPQPAASPGKAIVINGWKEGQAYGETFAENVKQVSGVLNGAGFDTSYFGPKSTDIPKDDDEGEMNYPRMGVWFKEASKDLKAGDTLFVYFTGHGFATKSGQGQLGGISEQQLRFWLRDIDPAVHVIVQIQGCYSGAFVDGIADRSDLTLTSTDEKSISVGDVDGGFLIFGITEPNPDDKGSEFTNGWVSDWNEIQADPAQRRQVEAQVSKKKTNYWVELSAFSYKSSLEKDAGFLSGKSFPLSARGSVVTRPVLLNGKVGSKVCRTGIPVEGEAPAMIDIQMALVSTDLEQETTDFRLFLPRADAFEGTFFGGVEFADPARPLSRPSSSWFGEGLGNLNFAFTLSSDRLEPFVHEYDEASGWGIREESSFDVEQVDHQIVATIPNDLIPLDAPFYIYLSDGEICDTVGLSEDRQLTGSIPAPLIDDTIFAPDKLGNDPPGGDGGDGALLGEPKTYAFDGSLIVATDTVGDVVSLPEETPADDPVVDITRVLIEHDPSDNQSPLVIQVQLDDPAATLREEFSFAISVTLALDGETQSAYLYQYHDGVDTIGRVDNPSQEIIPSDAEIILTERVLDGVPTGILELEIPSSEIPRLNQIPILSFHMAESDSERTHDSLLIQISPVLVIGDEP